MKDKHSDADPDHFAALFIIKSSVSRLCFFFFIMEACASGLRTRGLMFLAVLSLIKPTAGAFTSSTSGTESYAYTGTGDSDKSTAFSTDLSTDFSTDRSTDFSTGVLTDHSTDHSTGVSTDHSTGVSTDHSTGVSTDHSTGVSTDHSTGVSTDHSTGVSTGVSTDHSTDHLTGVSTDHSTGVSTDHSTGVSTDHSTRVSTDHSTRVSTDHSTRVSTDHSTRVSTDHSTRVSTDHSTRVSTDHSTRVSTDHSTRVSTDHSTRVSTDHSTRVSTDHSTRVSTDHSTGVSTDHSTRVSTDHSTGVSTDHSTRVSTDHSTGVLTDHSTGASTGGSTDHSTGGSTGVSTDFLTGVSTDFSTASKAASLGYTSTSKSSALHPIFLQRESHTATDRSLSTEVMKGWTTENRSDMSTDLPDSSSAFSTNTVTEFEDPSTVANITDAYTVAEREQHTSEFRTMRDLTVTKLTEQEQSRTDQDTTESGSNNDSTYISTTSRAGERTLLSIISNSTSTYVEDTSSSISGTHDITGQETEKGVTSISGTRDITGQETEKGVTSISGTRDITGQETEKGVTSISGTRDITGQETEKGVTSISGTRDITGQEREKGVTSFSGTHDITGQNTETGVTQHMESNENGVSTQSGHSTATSYDLSTNVTQEEGVNTKDSLGSGITQFRTGQPTVTGTNFESMAKTSNPSSTPPLTVINSSDSEADITANSSTNQDYTDISSSSSFVPPLVSEMTYTSVSHRYIETTETFTGPVISSTDEKSNEPMTFKEETTIPGLTVVPSTLLDITTSVDESQSTQQTFISQTNSPPELTTVLSTLAEPSTRMPPLTVEDKHKGSTVPVTSTTLDSMGTTAAFTTHQFQASTTTEAQSTPHSTLSATETTKKTAPTTEKHHPTTGTATPSLSASSSQSGPGATDVSTLHFENSTATPGSTTSHRQHTTASYNKTTSTTSAAAISTGKHTATKATTTEMPEKLSLTPGHMCKPQMCANGGQCVLMLGVYRCECLPGWRGENCTEDVDECASNLCPQKSKCVNTRGSFSCYCDFGYDMQDGRRCTKTKTFLVIFSINGSLHDSHTEILQLLNASLSNLYGYRRSTLLNLESLEILTVNMFSMSANVTRNDIFQRIQTSITNCNNSQSHCSLKLQYQLPYQVLSLCLPQDKRCDTEYGVWNDTDGTPYCQCHEEYFKNKQRDSTPRDCGNGFKLVNGSCIECPFGFGGFNCNNFYELIAKVVSPAAGGLLLIIIIALIIACCRKDKNDINKIIFKSGDLPMSPCGEFPKSNRVSMEWGRETIEMQENGSTKNLLQMTDIYYSPALRNADLERNGLYPFLGLPGSRHSCIYPAQWNPSFINDDTRRRDYF